MTSELQGNVIDLCPVGALTSKPNESQLRPWELQKTESIDVMDAVGSNIRVDSRGRAVMRILPRLNEQVNEEWISDKTRFVWDGLGTQRLDRPYVRNKTASLQPASWSEAFAAISARIKATEPKKIGAIAGDLASVEEMYRAEKPDGRDRFAKPRLPRAAEPDRSVEGQGELHLQHDHRRHREFRCAADRRRQPAPRGVGSECAHPQALARLGIPHRRDRREDGPALRVRLAGRRDRRRWRQLPTARPSSPRC